MMDKIYLKNSIGNKSLTTTVFIYGTAVCLLKFLVSGLVIKGFTIPIFSGGDFGMAMGSLGAIYVINKKQKKDASNGAA